MKHWKRVLSICIAMTGLWLILISWHWDREQRFVSAAQRGDVETVRAYLNEGMNPDIPTYANMNALKWASFQGNAAIVQLLLEQGAAPNAALKQAAMTGQTAILAMLLKKSKELPQEEGGVALCAAAESGNVEAVKVLLARGIDINYRTTWEIERGMTPLLYAARRGSLTMVRALEQRGANVMARSADGRTALMHAIESSDDDRVDLCRYLICQGVPINVADNQGKTTLMYAACQENSHISLKVLEMLLKNKANSEARDKSNKTAWSYAMELGSSKLVARLEDAGR